jgi:chromosome segregation ATPase
VTPLAAHQAASDKDALAKKVSGLEQKVKTLENDLDAATLKNNNLEKTVGDLQSKLSHAEECATQLRTELEAARNSISALEKDSGASSQKDNTIHELQAAINRLEGEKRTWQVMLGCQMKK